MNSFNKLVFYPLKYIQDERGAVLHYLKKNDVFFQKFGESYFSWINPGVIKGWYRNRKVTSLMTSPTANLQVVLYDGNEITNIRIEKQSYGLIKIPAGIWYAMKSLNDQPALVANQIDELYDPNGKDILPIDTTEIPYSWYANA